MNLDLGFYIFTSTIFLTWAVFLTIKVFFGNNVLIDQEKLDHLLHQSEKLYKILDDPDKDAEQLKKQKRNLEETVIKLQKDLADKDRQISEKQPEINKLILEVERIKKKEKVSSLENENTANLQNKVDELLKSLAAKEKELQQKKEEKSAVSNLNEINVLESTIGGLKNKVLEKDQEINILKNHAQTLETDLNRKAGEIKTVKEEVIKADNKHAEQLKQVSASVAAKQEEIDKLKWRMGELEAELKTKSENTSSAEEINSLKAELTKKKEEYNKGYNEYTQHLKQVRGSVSAKQEEIDKLKWRMGELEAELKTRSEDTKSLDEINALKAELTKKKEEYIKGYNDYTEHLKQVSGVVTTKQEEIDKLKWRMGELEAELKIKAENTSSFEEINSLKSELAKNKEEYNKGYNDYTEHLKQASGAVSAKQEEIDKLKWRLGELEAELKAKAQDSSSKEELDLVKAELAKKKEEYDKGYNSYTEHLKQVGEMIVSKDREIKTLRSVIDNAKPENENVENFDNDLKNKIESKLKELDNKYKENLELLAKTTGQPEFNEFRRIVHIDAIENQYETEIQKLKLEKAELEKKLNDGGAS
ncbi:MAG: hypothetical protein HQL29_06280 [Candidatus Omnitrophica bacterium]|nr:hypothetical protein [Candidatus Omnitrophota bacterium]